MATLSQIKMPNNTTHDILKNAFFGTCSTAAATADKVVTLSDAAGWSLKAGTIIGVKFANSNSASSCTLNVNGSGAKSVWYDDAVYTGNSIDICGSAGRTNYYMYDGTCWTWMNCGKAEPDLGLHVKDGKLYCRYKKKAPVCYAFHIDGSESDPAANITYLEEAVGMTPAHMDYANDRFDYGSWKDAFFIPKPCMLKYNGTVDYYLDPDDYTKRIDGTASDVANTNYGGNAMMEFPHIWIKIVPDANDFTSATFYISDTKLDENFHDYSNHNSKGVAVDHFYTPIYNGSVIDGKLRSLSGQQVSNKTTRSQEITYAKANNPSTDEMWNIENYSDRLTITVLLMLIGKSTNTQAVFGQGLNSGGSETVNDGFRTGQQNAKGLFYGTNSGTATTYSNAVKVFGMENFWGFQWKSYNGYIMVNGTQKVKLTYGTEDGSTVSGYNLTGEGYIAIDSSTPSGTSGGYINAMKFTDKAMIGTTASGSSTTYYCDGLWFNNGITAFVLFGGHSNGAAKVGAFCSRLDDDVSDADWDSGTALSCKPLT